MFTLPKSKILILLIACAVIGGGYKLISSYFGSLPPEEVKVVEVEKVTPTPITQKARLIGTIRAKRSTTLIAKATGFLEHQAQPGEKIKKGGLIAKLSNPEIEKNYTLTESAEKIAKDQFERRLSLQKTKVMSKKDIEDSRNAWIEAQKALSTAKIDYDKTRFEAPFDGQVGVYKIREGTQVKEGDAISTFYDPDDLIVEFDIPYPILKQLSPHSSVRIKEQQLEISHIQNMIDPDTHMAPAYVNFPCPEECIIGASISIDLIIAERKGALVIPHEAVFLQNEKQFVYLVKADQKKLKAVLTPVKLGIQEKDRVEITSGITKDDDVIIHGQSRLHPDDAVQIHKTIS